MKPAILSILVASILITASTTVAQTPSHLWSQGFGSTGAELANSVAVDDSGNVFLTGYFWWTVDFGGGDLVSAGQRDIVLAKYGPTGAHVWSKRFGDTGVDEANSVAVDDSGNVFLTGKFEDLIDFGGGNLISTGFHDIFLAKFDATGTHLWSQRFGATGAIEASEANSVATDDSGNVFITGDFTDTVDFGGGNLVSDGSNDIFLAKYSSNGTHLWSQAFGTTSIDIGYAIATDDSGNVFMTGVFVGDVNFGGGVLSSTFFSADIVVAKYGPTGTHVWSQRFGGPGWNEYPRSLATDASGNVFMMGGFSGTVDFGGGNLVAAGSNTDIVLAKYDSTGTHLWSQRFGNTGIETSGSVATDASGNVFMTGAFADTVDFGGGGLPGAVGTDMFVAKYDSTGAHLWSQNRGSTESVAGQSVAIDDSGSVLITGNFSGIAHFGGGNIASAGNADMFIVKYGLSIGTGVGDTPQRYPLSVSNFPNPFNPSTTIRYTAPSRGNVSVAIFDVRGARVATLVDNKSVGMGTHRTEWDGRSDVGAVVSSGVYFARVEFNGTAHTQKMVLLK